MGTYAVRTKSTIESGKMFVEQLSLLLFVFFGCSDGMEREACVCDHGYERSDLCAEIIIIIIIILYYYYTCQRTKAGHFE